MRVVEEREARAKAGNWAVRPGWLAISVARVAAAAMARGVTAVKVEQEASRWAWVIRG